MKSPLGEREREMYRLHTVEGWTLVEIARRYHVSRERVRQLLYEYARASTGERTSSRTMSKTAARARRARKLALAQAHARQVIAAWRTGEEPKGIAARFELGRRCVEQVIRTEATIGDRVVRARARRMAKAGLEHQPSSEQLVMHALASCPDATASELANAAGLAYGTTTVVLRKLEQEGEAARARGSYVDGRRLPDRWTLSVPSARRPVRGSATAFRPVGESSGDGRPGRL